MLIFVGKSVRIRATRKQCIQKKEGGHMVIKLPYEFRKTYHHANKTCYAKIRYGMLEIYGDVEMFYDKIMRDLTFKLKNPKECYYCREKINSEEVTMDHLYPRDFGGISIPENLEPSCPDCNVKKSNMNEEEFEEWKKIDNEIKRKKYYVENIMRKKEALKNGTIDLPKEWLSRISISIIKTTTNNNSKRKKDYKTVIVSSNNFLLSGRITLDKAIKSGMKKIDVVILDNVVYYDGK